MITEFIVKIKQTPQFSQELANFTQILGLDASQRAFSQRKVVLFEKWNEQPCVPIMPDLQELHWTNEKKAERIRATRLGYRPTVDLLGAAGCSRSRESRDTVIQSAGRYSEEIRINNISIKSCEKHSNSAPHSVKATFIRTNTTDVNQEKHCSINKYLHHSPWI